MTGHVRIFLHFVTLMVGIWAVFYSTQLYKNYKYPFLRPLVYYILFFNLMVFQNIASNYVKTNLLTYDGSADLQAYHIIGITLRIVALSGLSYSFLHVSVGLLEKTISIRIRRLLLTGMITIMLIYSVGMTITFLGSSSRCLLILEMCLFSITINIIYASSMALLLDKKVARNRNNRKAW